MTDKRQEAAPGTAAVFLLICLGLDALLRQRTDALVFSGLFPFLWIALAVVLLVYFRHRLARRADEEKQEETLALEERPESALFGPGDEEAEPFSMARSREQFERFVVPAVSPLLALLELFLAWKLYRRLGMLSDPPNGLLFASALLAGQAFVLFLLSRYLLGLSRNPDQQLLRGPGVYLGLACFVSLLAMAAAILAEIGVAQADRIAAWCMITFLVLLGIENVLRTLGQLYRPRRGKQELNTTYESRIGALLTDPGTWVRNVAQALDYQFGFGVSQTWFYRFLQNALLPLFIFQVLVLYLLSCLVFLGPEEEGIMERFGRPLDRSSARGHLQSGFYLKWPWPFETVRRFPAKRVMTQHIGFAHAEEHTPEAIVWAVPHHEKPETFLTANREQAGADDTAVAVNLLSVHVPIQYRITNVYSYAYNYADPDKVLEQVAYRSLTREAVSRGLFDMVGEGQLEVARLLRKRIQQDVDRMDLGIKIEFVGLQGVHPPTPIVDAFESVIGALEEKEAAVHRARAYTNQVLPLARAEAEAAGHAAAAYKTRRVALASSESYRFEQRLKGFKKSPSVFKTDIYLRTMRDALTGTRKYIISAVPASEVIQLDFGEKVKPDLFDFSPETDKGSER